MSALLSPEPAGRPAAAATVRRELEQLHQALEKETVRKEAAGAFLETLPRQTRQLRTAKSLLAAATVWGPALAALARCWPGWWKAYSRTS